MLLKIHKTLFLLPSLACGSRIAEAIAIKRSINKLTLATSLQDIRDQISSKQVSILPITVNHLETVEKLAYEGKHRDPFDRLIISQAIAEDMILISSDSYFKNYPVNVFW